MLRHNGFSAEQVEAIVKDFRSAGLPPAEVAMMAFAQKVIHQAYAITRQDTDDLRSHGFADEEILDIALAAAARSFYSRVVDATGAEPDQVYMEMDERLRAALTVGRPFGS